MTGSWLRWASTGLLLVLLLAATPGQGAVNVVNQTGQPDCHAQGGGTTNSTHRNISWAIANSTAGDTTIVCAGLYTESITINRALILRANNTTYDVTVNASSTTSDTIAITANNVNLSWLKVQNATGTFRAGINGSIVSAANISNVWATSNYHAIYLLSSGNSLLFGNNASNNTVDGIHLSSSNNNTLANNTADNNSVASGIFLSSSNNNTLVGNLARQNNGWGFLLSSSHDNLLSDNVADSNNDGFTVSASQRNNLTNNTANNHGNYGFTISSSNNTTLTGNIANGSIVGFSVAGSSTRNITLANNTATNNSNIGMQIASSYTLLTNNTATGNAHGILVATPGSGNTLANNTARNNSVTGIYLLLSSSNTLTGNTAANNTIGFQVSDSNDNAMTNNTARNNTDYGFYIGATSQSNTVTNGSATNNSIGVFLYPQGRYNRLINISVDGNTQDGLVIDSADHNLLDRMTISSNGRNGSSVVNSMNLSINDSTLSGSGWSDINLSGSSVNLTNATVNSTWPKTSLGGASNLTVRWWLQACPAPSDASVAIAGNNLSALTAAVPSGENLWAVAEYTNFTLWNTTDYNPYTIGASQSGYGTATYPLNIRSSRTGSSCVALNLSHSLSLTTPTEGQLVTLNTPFLIGGSAPNASTVSFWVFDSSGTTANGLCLSTNISVAGSALGWRFETGSSLGYSITNHTGSRTLVVQAPGPDGNYSDGAQLGTSPSNQDPTSWSHNPNYACFNDSLPSNSLLNNKNGNQIRAILQTRAYAVESDDVQVFRVVNFTVSPSCTALGGVACSVGQTCSGSTLSAPDAALCCAGTCVSPATTGGGGGGRGGGGTPPQPQTSALSFSSAPILEVFKRLPEIPRERPIHIPIEQGEVTGVILEASQAILRGSLAIRSYDTPPEGIQPPAKHTFRYLDIRLESARPGDLQRAKILFRIPDEWVEKNGLGLDTIRLHHFSGREKKWDALSTKRLVENATTTHYLYEAETPGFSLFAITAEPVASVPGFRPSPSPLPEAPVRHSPPSPRILVPVASSSDLIPIVLAAATVASIAGGGYVALRYKSELSRGLAELRGDVRKTVWRVQRARPRPQHARPRPLKQINWTREERKRIGRRPSAKPPSRPLPTVHSVPSSPSGPPLLPLQAPTIEERLYAIVARIKTMEEESGPSPQPLGESIERMSEWDLIYLIGNTERALRNAEYLSRRNTMSQEEYGKLRGQLEEKLGRARRRLRRLEQETR